MGRLLAAAAAIAVIFSLVALAPAQARPGLRFATAKPLSLSWEEFVAGERVKVCNGGGSPVLKPTTVVGGFGFELNKHREGNSSVLIFKPRFRKVPAGKCRSLVVRAGARAEVDAGTYVGALAVAASGAGVARLGLTIAGPEAVTKPAAVSGAGGEAVLHAVNDTPGALRPRGR